MYGKLFVRDDAPPVSHTMITLIVVLLVLVLLGIALVAGLMFLRARKRKARMMESLPVYDEKRLSTASSTSTHRRIMVRPAESIYVYQEKGGLSDDFDGPPQSPLPEIHITFPEEIDDSGKRKSGRVVVVHLGDSSVGLEPTETLPAYQQTEGGRFQSIDLDRIGGLVEKAKNVSGKETQ